MKGSSAWPGLVLLLAVLAPLTLWRAHLETGLWEDETYSLLLTTYPAGEVVERTALDAHPPGYYLALKAWLKGARFAGGEAGSGLGFEPGVLWARLLNVLLWVCLAAAAWFGGRGLLGRRAGTLLAWVVAGGACAAWLARDLRGHGAASVFLFGSYLALVALAALALELGREGAGGRRARPSRREVWALWGAYAVCATLALWTHLLSGLVLAALGVAWLGFVAASRRLDGPTLGCAVVANLAPGLLFAPWLVKIGRQVGYLEGSDPRWMTPPTLANLGWVVSFWYPLGRVGEPTADGNGLLRLLGVAAVLVPVGMVMLLAWRCRAEARETAGPARPGEGRSPVAALAAGAVIGLGGAALYVVAIWLLARLEVAPTFHGPRYPALAVHLWAAGLVCLLAWAAARGRVRFRWVVLALVPWLVASAVGQVRGARQEAWGALSEIRAAAGPAWPSAGEPLYALPSELLPFYRRTLAAFDLRRIERLPCEEEAGSSAAVLDVSSWPELDRVRDHLVRAALDGRRPARLGGEVRRVAYPPPPDRASLVLYRVEDLDGALLRELCRRGLQPPLRDRMTRSVSEALPEDQLSPEHWSYLEVSPDLEVYRWSRARRTPVAFDRPLAPGDYVLHVEGHRPPGAQRPKPVSFVLDEAGLAVEEELPPGRFHVCLEVPWPREGEVPRLVVEHPLWHTADPGHPSRRTLGFLLYGAWFSPLDGGVSPLETRSCTSAFEAGPNRKGKSP